MPIYEFLCQKCGHKFEEFFFSSKEEIKVNCPHCNSEDTKKLFSAFGFTSSGKFVASKNGKSCQSCSSKTCNSCS